MNLVDTVTLMIRSYPGLYGTRSQALKALFTGGKTRWESGDLVFIDPSEYTGIPLCLASPEIEEDETPVERLKRRKILNDELFIVSNAKDIARYCATPLKSKCLWLPEKYDRFADMPEDVNHDWKQASKTILFELYGLTSDAKEHSLESNAHKALTRNMVRFGFLNCDQLKATAIQLEKELDEVKASLKAKGN